MAFDTATGITTVSTAAIDPGKPAGSNSSHILVAVLSTSRSDPVTNGFTAPAGWTSILSPEDFILTDVGALCAFWAPGDVASTAFTRAGTGVQDSQAQVLRFSNRNLSSPIIASNFEQNASNETALGADSLDAETNSDGVWMWVHQLSNTQIVPPGDLTLRGDGGTASTVMRMVVATLDAIPAGPTGVKNATVAASFQRKGWMGALLRAEGSVVTIPMGVRIYVNA